MYYAAGTTKNTTETEKINQMRFLLIRHGHPDYEHDTLTETGLREAALLAKRLAKEKIDYFYCSPLGRAKKTAEPTLLATGKSAEILDWAMEMPCAVNVNYSELGLDFEGRISPWDMLPPYWTTKPEMYDREAWRDLPVFKNSNVPERYDIIAEGFEKLMLQHGLKKEGQYYRITPDYKKDTVIALFAHMGFGNCLLSQITGMPLPAFWHCFFLPPTSVTTVSFETYGMCPGIAMPRIVSLGDATHLTAGGEPISSSGMHSPM